MEANKCECNDLDLMWNILIDEYNVPENTIRLMTTINGYNTQTLHDLLYAVAGEQLFDSDDPELLDPCEM